jgi:hypothetical protein
MHQLTRRLDALIDRFLDPETSTLERFLLALQAGIGFVEALVTGRPTNASCLLRALAGALKAVVRGSRLTRSHLPELSVGNAVLSYVVHNPLIGIAGQASACAAARGGRLLETKQREVSTLLALSDAEQAGFQFGELVQTLARRPYGSGG